MSKEAQILQALVTIGVGLVIVGVLVYLITSFIGEVNLKSRKSKELKPEDIEPMDTSRDTRSSSESEV